MKISIEFGVSATNGSSAITVRLHTDDALDRPTSRVSAFQGSPSPSHYGAGDASRSSSSASVERAMVGEGLADLVVDAVITRVGAEYGFLHSDAVAEPIYFRRDVAGGVSGGLLTPGLTVLATIRRSGGRAWATHLATSDLTHNRSFTQ